MGCDLTFWPACFSYVFSYNIGGPERSINTARDSLAFRFIFMEKKLLSVFVDESGDDGFGKEGSSEFYIFTMVFHDQRIGIESNVEKIAHLPVFHAAPILRREEPFENDEPEDRKKLFQSIFVFASALPVKWTTFKYRKKEFKDYLSLQRRIFRDLRQYLYDHQRFWNGVHWRMAFQEHLPQDA